jgi:hypothetical protein
MDIQFILLVVNEHLALVLPHQDRLKDYVTQIYKKHYEIWVVKMARSPFSVDLDRKNRAGDAKTTATREKRVSDTFFRHSHSQHKVRHNHNNATITND